MFNLSIEIKWMSERNLKSLYLENLSLNRVPRGLILVTERFQKWIKLDLKLKLRILVKFKSGCLLQSLNARVSPCTKTYVEKAA